MNHGTRTAWLIVMTLAMPGLIGCTRQLEGTYSGADAATGERTGFLDSVTFKSGNEVEATFLGETRTGTYRIDSDQVTIIIGNDASPEVMTITADDCLIGPGFVGRYCKTGRTAASGPTVVASGAPTADRSAAAEAAPIDPGVIVGNYEARDPATGQGMRLEFDAGRGVTLTMLDPGIPPESGRASYVVEGDRVTLMNDSGIPMVFMREGNALVYTEGGESIRLERQQVDQTSQPK